MAERAAFSVRGRSSSGFDGRRSGVGLPAAAGWATIPADNCTVPEVATGGGGILCRG